MIGLARCAAEPRKMFVGYRSKKTDAAIGSAKISRKFCRQWKKTASRGKHVVMVISNKNS